MATRGLNVLTVAEEHPRPGGVELRPQGEIVIVLALVRTSSEMSHAAGGDQQRRRRCPLLLPGLEPMNAEVERHLAQRANRLIRHAIILPHRVTAGADLAP